MLLHDRRAAAGAVGTCGGCGSGGGGSGVRLGPAAAAEHLASVVDVPPQLLLE